MKTIWQYELIKICKKRMFIVLSILLLIGNLLTLHTYERTKSTFFYAYEQKNQYQSYLAGDEQADIDGYYQRELLQQEKYLATYPKFLDEMSIRAEELKSLSTYSDKNSYVYRNLDKTCKDFDSLSGIVVVEDNCFGIRELIKYDWGILFLLIFIAITSYFLFYHERNQGLLLLIKGTKKGHIPLATSKLGTMFFLTLLYEMFQEGSTILLLGYFYGYGNLGRSIQSVSEFRNCPYRLSVIMAILVIFLIRVVIAEVLASILFLISVVVRNELLAILLMGLLFGVEFWVAKTLSITGSLNGLKCINVFFYWNAKQALGVYQNLNLNGYAASKDICALIVALLLSTSCAIYGIVRFHLSCQIRSESKLEKLLVWMSKKTRFLWGHTSLLRFECSKVVIQQKKCWLLFFLLILFIFEIITTQRKTFYSTAGIAQYHAHLSHLAGKVTDESIVYVDSEIAYIEELYQQLKQIGSDTTGKNAILSLQIKAELEAREEGAYMLLNQLDALKEKTGNLYDKYWVDELAYKDKMEDVKANVAWWFIGMTATIIWTSGIYPNDEKKKLLPLLRSTKKGRRNLIIKKNLCIAIGTLIIFILTQLPLLMGFYGIDSFAVLSQKMSDLTWTLFSGEMTIGTFLFILFLLKAITFSLGAFGGVQISKVTHNEAITNIIGIGVIGIVAVMLLYFHIDISVAMLRLLQR